MDIDWVLFDWGDVLVEYNPGGVARLAQRLGETSAEVGAFLQEGGLLRELCLGAVEPDVALDALAARFGQRLSRADAVECFRPDVSVELPGVDQLLSDLQGRVRLGVLSNTFFGHWDAFTQTALYGRFELPMASHLLGALKPDARIYERALERTGAQARAVVFVDDKQENVDAAARLGMRTVLSKRSVPTTRAGLAALLPGLPSR